jgi:amino acid permease
MELHVRTKRTINQVIVRTNGIALVIFLIVGFFGYLIFVPQVNEQILAPERNRNILEANFGDSSLI